MTEEEKKWMIRETISEVLLEMAQMVRQERDVPMIYCPLEMMTDVSGLVNTIVQRVKDKMTNKSQGDAPTSTNIDMSHTIVSV